MKKIHLIWIIPLTMVISIFGFSAITFQADKDVFVFGQTMACYEGCTEMLSIENNFTYPIENTTLESLMKKKYNVCSQHCNTKFFDKNFS